MSGHKTPDVIPAYGEAGPEAEAMDKAADGDRSGTDAANAAERSLPPDAPVQNHGTTEVDITSRINETADRASQQPD